MNGYPDSGIYFLVKRTEVDTTLRYYETLPILTKWDTAEPLKKIKHIHSMKIEDDILIISYIRHNDTTGRITHNLSRWFYCE